MSKCHETTAMHLEGGLFNGELNDIHGYYGTPTPLDKKILEKSKRTCTNGRLENESMDI